MCSLRRLPGKGQMGAGDWRSRIPQAAEAGCTQVWDWHADPCLLSQICNPTHHPPTCVGCGVSEHCHDVHLADTNCATHVSRQDGGGVGGQGVQEGLRIGCACASIHEGHSGGHNDRARACGAKHHISPAWLAWHGRRQQACWVASGVACPWSTLPCPSRLCLRHPLAPPVAAALAGQHQAPAAAPVLMADAMRRW